MEKYITFEHFSAHFALSASDFELSASETCPSFKFQSEMMISLFPRGKYTPHNCHCTKCVTNNKEGQLKHFSNDQV